MWKGCKYKNSWQASHPTSTYLLEFQQQLTCDVNWNEESYINQFCWGLWNDVKELMITMPKMNIWNEFIIQPITYDNQLFERWQEKKLTSYTQPFKNTFTNTLHMTHNQAIGDKPMQIDVAQFKAFTLEKMFNASDN